MQYSFFKKGSENSMKTKRMTWLTKILGLCGLSLFALPASAHISVMHSVGGFEAGLMHPITGLRQLFAMVGVGLLGGKNQGVAEMGLTVVFPLMMAIGAIAG